MEFRQSEKVGTLNTENNDRVILTPQAGSFLGDIML